jgi:hypothetical protein
MTTFPCRIMRLRKVFTVLVSGKFRVTLYTARLKLLRGEAALRHLHQALHEGSPQTASASPPGAGA